MKSLAKPVLDKPVPHWSHDLPLPNSEESNRLEVWGLLINHADEIYLEIPRSTHRIRGVAVWISLVMGAFCVIAFFLGIQVNITSRLGALYFIPTIIITAAGLWASVYMWRMDTEAPKDEPIRLNRARRKVYIYRFHHDGRRPFSKTAWFTRAEVFDWDNLRAEASSFYGPMGGGGLIEGVFLAVVEPETNNVTDRFLLAHGGFEAEMYWTMARLYMQKGPEALPQFDRPPRDWNNEEIVFNLARYLAPKVEWPEDLDIESRTAPS